MKKNHSWKSKLIYKIDCIFSEGTSAMILFLGIASITIILIASVIAVIFHITPQEFNLLLIFSKHFGQA